MNKLYPLHATIGSLLLLGALAACNDKQMCDLPHPHPGRAVLTYDWGTATPRDVQLEVLPYDDPLATPATATHTPADGTTLDRLAPGRYHALAYTEAERLSVSNGTAAVTDTEDDGCLPSVGDLWAGSTHLTIESGTDTRATIGLQPCTRLLRIVLNAGQGDPTQVQSLTGLLTGVRTSRVIDPWLAGQVPATAATTATGSIRLHFTPTDDGTAFAAEHRLLGLDPAQGITLTLTLTTDDGRDDTQDYDLTDELEDFDDFDNPGADDPDDPFDLGGDIDLIVTSPIDALFSISGWGQVDSTEGGADMEIKGRTDKE